MVKKSRLKNYESRTALVRLIVATTITALLIFAGIKLLPKILLEIPSLYSNTQPVSQADNNQDKIPPFPPRLDSLPAATSEGTINIAGYAEPKSSIDLYRNSKLLDTFPTDSDGKFELKDAQLVKGKNIFYALATDAAGNKSKKSARQTVNYKTEGPNIEIEAIADTDKGVATIQGTTSSDAKVTVNGRRIVVNRNGSFRAEFKLQPGENSFEAVATDSAGNKTHKTISVTYEPKEE